MMPSFRQLNSFFINILREEHIRRETRIETKRRILLKSQPPLIGSGNEDFET